MNKVILSGNLVKDPELKRTTSGTSVVNGTIAVNEYQKGAEDKTFFINFICWSKQAEYVAQYANKGDRLELCGRWTQRYWTDRNGNNRRSDEVMVESISVYKPRSERSASADYGSPTPSDEGATDDLPF